MGHDPLLAEVPEGDSVSTSLLPEGFDADLQSGGPCCEKCGAAISTQGSLVCRQCGWYASIDSYVEIDKGWEVATDPTLATDAGQLPTPQASLPAWAWILGGCLLAVVVESLVACHLTAEGSAQRTTWSLWQLLIGFLSFTFCHTICYILGTKNDADVKALDYLLRPIKTWSVVLRDLPERAWVCYVGLSGFLAMAMSVLLIGGIPYERLTDWDVKKKAKFNLIGAITSQAANRAADDKSLEEAVGELGGKADLDKDKKNPTPNQRKNEDCIIIGYMTNQAGEIKTLLLAAEHYFKLKYAGSVRVTGLPDKDRQELARKLKSIRTRRPFVRISIDNATWVKPKQLCRVSYRRRGKQGGLYGAKLVELLGEVQVGGS